jgi:hypothetical protein
MKAPTRLARLAIGAALAIGTGAPSNGAPVQTTSDANSESLKGAAEAPLRDINVLRTKIPYILLQALADPYARPSSSRCLVLIAELKPLNEALGPDLDVPPADEKSMSEKGRGSVLGAVAGVASDMIPFHSWVRKLSGAEQHDRYVQQAIMAGAVRRGYLKGLGEAHGCLPPATPSHVKAGSPVLEDGKPRYPTK